MQTKNFYAMQLNRHRCNLFTIGPIRDGRTKGHLQIEGGLVPFGEAHHAISSALLDTPKNERQEMLKLIATLVNRRRGSNAANRRRPHCLDANVLLALARALDSHVERHNLCHEDSCLIESATPLGISWRQRRRCRSQKRLTGLHGI
jgi:hypothetical protein